MTTFGVLVQSNQDLAFCPEFLGRSRPPIKLAFFVPLLTSASLPSLLTSHLIATAFLRDQDLDMAFINYMSLLQAAVFVGITYCIVLVTRRLYFSPISHFPGPKLAIATFWYQFYYDVILGGQYVWKVRDLHKKYGPIVRINPFELHVDDPDFLEDIFTGPGSHKRDKWEWATKGLGVPGATLMTNGHDLHRLRRAALNPFFSKASVRNLQPLIDAKLDFFIERFEEFHKNGEVMVINHAFAALTNGRLKAW
jgi:hypothetical protein